jgi:hypothetical protein
MSFSVSSWYYSQMLSPVSSPVRQFIFGSSDYSSKVVEWPKFSRSGQNVVSSKPSLTLDNADGAMNFVMDAIWCFPNTCQCKWGYTHPVSGTEYVPLFTGKVFEVEYSESKCKLNLRDKLWDMTNINLGSVDSNISYNNYTPAMMAFLLMGIGGLSQIGSSTNPDIDFLSYSNTYYDFWNDSVVVSVKYQGEKVLEGLSGLSIYSDMAIWQEGNGKMYMKRYGMPSSLDFVVTRREYTDLKIVLEGVSLVNKAWVYGLYQPESQYWALNAYMIDTISVNTYGLREQVLKDSSVWYVDSNSALNRGARITRILSKPPKKFELTTPMIGLHRQMGETIRIVEPFFNVGSNTAWRIVELEFDMEKGKTKYVLDEALPGNSFLLDVDYLDGDQLLL